MNSGDKLTERTYNVRLIRPWSGSAFTTQVTAFSPAQAQRKAEDANPGWKAQGIA